MRQTISEKYHDAWHSVEATRPAIVSPKCCTPNSREQAPFWPWRHGEILQQLEWTSNNWLGECQVQKLVQESVLKDTWCNKFGRGVGEEVDPDEKLDSKPKEPVNGQGWKLRPREGRESLAQGYRLGWYKNSDLWSPRPRLQSLLVISALPVAQRPGPYPPEEPP